MNDEQGQDVGADDTDVGRPSPLEVYDALNEPRPDLAGPVTNDDESPLAAAAAAELARAEAIEQSLADAIEEQAFDVPEVDVDESPPDAFDDSAAADLGPGAEQGTQDGPEDRPGADADRPDTDPDATDHAAWEPVGGDETRSAQGGVEDELSGAALAESASPGPDELRIPELSAEPGAWSVLGRALKPRMTRAQVLAGVLCALLGFALVVQVRQAAGADLNSMRQQDLVRILDEVTNRGDALASESADLTRERDQLLSGSDRRQAALDALRRSAETQGILTGRLPAEGPGVAVTLTEPDGLIKPVTMLEVLEELRNAGAEAISLNGQRVTASSAFTGTAGSVVLDGATLSSPYVWLVIGDPDTIDPALQIPGGAMAQVRLNGGQGEVEQRDNVQITALRVIPDPVFATPIPLSGD
ncbi:DUF881 domain-containing protein [Cellulomonas sp. URHE0023]|uniref:DUF881 domain-containing protein n=1 Tax=Cellulomonas sp. URHE0023 TaxID=1380354 RepID=UPI00068B7F61|nr:DUF881 domain-containing protein [Cellulomonas sp. URHE0023]